MLMNCKECGIVKQCIHSDVLDIWLCRDCLIELETNYIMKDDLIGYHKYKKQEGGTKNG